MVATAAISRFVKQKKAKKPRFSANVAIMQRPYSQLLILGNFMDLTLIIRASGTILRSDLVSAMPILRFP
jgi:hypothetical protein